MTKFREKLYSNPELLEEYRRKEREREVRLGDVTAGVIRKRKKKH